MGNERSYESLLNRGLYSTTKGSVMVEGLTLTTRVVILVVFIIGHHN